MEQCIIDFHVHPFQDESHCLHFYPERSDFTAAGLRRELENAGITHICGSVLQWSKITDFDQVRQLNRYALELRRELGDFYTPGFHVHPAFVEESCWEMEQMHRRGVNLLGELVPYIHGWQGGETALMEILSAAPAGLVCSYHTPTDLNMEPLLQAYPQIQFVAAHPGDREQVEAHIAMMRKYDNLHLDLSGTGLFRLGLVRHLIDNVGAERILFATDYPICNPRMYVQAIYGENLTEKERELIFCKNARRILGIAGWEPNQ